MPVSRSLKTSPHPEWTAFASRHEGNPFLAQDALYALSEEIVDAITAEAPRFFTPAEENFERDLARTADFGVFLNCPLGSGFVASSIEKPEQPNPAAWMTSTDQQINAMLMDELCRAGVDPLERDEYFKEAAAQMGITETRQDAYLGWLVVNSHFRDELCQFRTIWEKAVRKAGRFPSLPRWMVGDVTSGIRLAGELREACYEFYRRWDLERMLTWDWPVPMEPDFLGGWPQDVEVRHGAGMFLFVPWHMLRGEKLNLQDVAKLRRTLSVPEHLSDWVNKRRKGDLGEIRYRSLGWLYRYYELALMRRYKDKCDRNKHKLDQALARVIDRDADTVKKLRLELDRVADY
jgi:hypothetical protein